MLVTFVYGVSTALILAGAVMYIFMKISFGGVLICLTLAGTSAFQGWVISKLLKQQLKDKEEEDK